ncbi:hydrogen peroxide-inducible genes activator [Sphingobacterium sp. HJSM2_6]|uniref:hydrogen peroxide-inducible genes activator n=1 Tax=Sphingobacterium sp. HJSM2_6 TaxID=3366264 RepID=UPI003BE23742
MNIQQLQYIVAVDEHRHFLKASEACFITPATLSMMIKKLEQELDVVIFDRAKQPVVPTDLGKSIIEKARNVLYHVKELESVAKKGNYELQGEVRIGIIPTLAPYLSHLILPPMMEKYPLLKIRLFEWNTQQIVEALKHDRLDIGIAATPLSNPDIQETPLFYESLVVYSTEKQNPKKKKYLVPADLNMKRLWLLEEDHCLRSQVANLCSLRKKMAENEQLEFEAGSIETLLNMVEMNDGITILPELAIHSLAAHRKEHIAYFKAPIPVREISLLTYRQYVKEKLNIALSNIIKTTIQPLLLHQKGKQRVIEIG